MSSTPVSSGPRFCSQCGDASAGAFGSGDELPGREVDGQLLLDVHVRRLVEIVTDRPDAQRILPGMGGIFRIAPPLTVSDAELAAGFDERLGESLVAAAQAGRRAVGEGPQ